MNNKQPKSPTSPTSPKPLQSFIKGFLVTFIPALVIILTLFNAYNNHSSISALLLWAIQGGVIYITVLTVYGGIYFRATIRLDEAFKDIDSRMDNLSNKDLKKAIWIGRLIDIWSLFPSVYLSLNYRLVLITLSSVTVFIVGLLMTLNLIDPVQFSPVRIGIIFFFTGLNLLINILEMSMGFDEAEANKVTEMKANKVTANKVTANKDKK